MILTLCFVTVFLSLPSVSGENEAIQYKFHPGDAGNPGGLSLIKEKLYLPFPRLVSRDGKVQSRDGKEQQGKIIAITANHAELSYPCGATLRVAVTPGYRISMKFDNVPEDIDSCVQSVVIPFEAYTGGQCYLGEDKVRRLGDNQGVIAYRNSDICAIVPIHGNGVKFMSREKILFRLQDNRKWGWTTFELFLEKKISTTSSELAFSILPVTPDGFEKLKPAAGIRVDEFGQSARKNWNGKVTSEEELKADVATEREYYSSLQPPRRDKFGGLPGSREQFGLSATGYFHVGKVNNRDVLVTPEGNLYFGLSCAALGFCDTITYIKGRENIFKHLPDFAGEFRSAYAIGDRDNFSFYYANLIRKYGKINDRQWKSMFVKRLLKWGFNATGPWGSDKEGEMAYMEMLPDKVPYIVDRTFDPFDPQSVKKLDDSFQQKISPSANDPYLVGYYIQNEPRLDEISYEIPKMNGTVAAKRRLVDLLKSRYPDVSAFNSAWGMQIGSMDELYDLPLAGKTAQGKEDLKAFFRIFLEKYLQTVSTTFHKYDPNHLLLGSRYMPHTVSNEVAEITGKYVDVFSINYYTHGIDREYLTRLHAYAKKPFILSEFNFGTSEQLSGGVRDVDNQCDRGLAYRNYVEQSAELPFVVGTVWFECLDQATTGRWMSKYNGECYNTGLVNVADRPYREFLAEVMKTNYHIYELILGQTQPFRFNRPEFMIGRPTHFRKTMTVPKGRPNMKIDGLMNDWPDTPPTLIPGQHLVDGLPESNWEAAFWSCWDEQKLYFFLKVKDPSPRQNIRTGTDLWNGDCVEIFIGSESPEKRGPLLYSDRQLVVGCGRKTQHCWFNNQQEIPCETAVVSDGDGYTVEIAIPLQTVGIDPQNSGIFLLDIGFGNSQDGQKRLGHYMWSGSTHNSRERDYWAEAKLSQ